MARFAACCVAAIALGSSGCVSRILHDVACEDGRVGSGEICFDGAERLAIDVPFSPLSVRVDDFDGDAHRDLLVLGVDTAGVVRGALVAGDGTGGFAAAADAGVFGCSAYPVPGRFDGDAPADLLVDECDESMLGFFGSTSGSFVGPTRIEVGALTRTSAIIDVDRDGNGDVLVLGDPGDGSAVLTATRRLADGGFAAPVALAVGGHDGRPPAVGFSIGDVDGDGTIDALLSIEGGTESPMLATGRTDTLGFSTPQTWTAIAPTRGAGLRDLDGDDVLEVLTRPGTSNALAVYERSGGEYRLAETSDLGPAGDALLEAGRIDGDDHTDLASYGAGATSIELWLGEDFAWDSSVAVEIGAVVHQLVLADIDEDGAADLVAGTFDDGTITVVRARP